MKSINHTNNNNNNNSSNNTSSSSSWLGFSLSPHMTMEVSSNDHAHHHHHHYQAMSTASVPSVFFPSSTTPPLYYGLGGDHNAAAAAAYYSQLSSMPLKSDGSLCIMEALRRTEQDGMVPSASPKLEDFLGGGAHHQYGSNNQRQMASSLDNSIYYGQSQFLQPLHQGTVCTMLSGHEMYQNAPLVEEAMAHEDGMHGFKNWLMARSYGNGAGPAGNSSGISDEGSISSASVGALGYGDHLHPLSLSMSSGSQSSCVTALHQQQHQQQQVSHGNNTTSEYMALDGSKKRGGNERAVQKQPVHRKSIDTFGQRTSQYRGVTRHRWTGRYEAHLWDNSCKKEGQTRKGRQVYLGGYDMEEKAARAYDLAALKYWGPSTHINFPLENYQEELEEMKNMNRQEYVAHLRRKSSGFSRGASMYRGVTRHHQHGRWQARIGRVSGNKDLYLGTFSTQEEAAEAYDIAAIKFRGLNAVTNFDITRYDVEKIMESNTLLPGELARRKKDTDSINAAVSATTNLIQNGIASEHWKVTAMPCSDEQQNHDVLHVASDIRNEQLAVLHDLINVDAVEHESNGNAAHVSNASSLVTSLGNSREQSPDRGSLAMLFAKPTAKMTSPMPLSSWIPSASATRPAVSIAHLPVFAAWTDA